MKNWDRFPNRSPWTPAQVARLREMRIKGASFDEIAHEVGHTAYACQSKAVQLGIRAPRIVAAQKCIPIVQKPEAPRHQQPWTKEEEQRLLALATHRLSHEEIGAKLNRTAVSVELRLHLLSRGVVGAKKSEGSRRPCMCCKQPFSSQGSGNRLCKNCRNLDAGPEPARIVLR